MPFAADFVPRRVLSLVLLCLPLVAARAETADEPALRAAVEQAVWPGDIVRAADRYLGRFPAGSGAAAVTRQRQLAAEAWQLVSRNEVRLYRSAFVPSPDESALRDDLRRAALGDREAAVRLAQACRPLDGAQGTQRWIGWLQYASALGDDRASYELALHYRRNDQPLLAARYEAAAVALGYRPAPSLDNVRK